MPSHEIDISEEAGVRYLHFGSAWIQGAMRIRRPVDLELVYTREMMAGLLMREDWLSDRPPTRQILLIGLGAGSKLEQRKVSALRSFYDEYFDAVGATVKYSQGTTCQK